MTDMISYCEDYMLARRESLGIPFTGWDLDDFVGAGACGCVFRVSKDVPGGRLYSVLDVIPMSRQRDYLDLTSGSMHESLPGWRICLPNPSPNRSRNRSRPLVANADKLLLLDDVIVSGSGYTSEDDFIIQLDAASGRSWHASR